MKTQRLTITLVLCLMSVAHSAFAVDITEKCSTMLQSSLSVNQTLKNNLFSRRINAKDYRMALEDQQIVLRIHARTCALLHPESEKEIAYHQFMNQYNAALEEPSTTGYVGRVVVGR